ncbi:uncharacterized protein LOC126987898 isoform X1 [Eriocheir sinensis]|uniref:uncharacterized protein LOC126987898 isoform X1 n=1 Tax=Eriocheir sinensis TaxID=95602 RepID=UPI0021C68B25|nr:uncharacterized protein LOC126987898 isoform X1 [Eriocheir sinensis]
MIIKRLTYLAVCLLVLLNVVSTMGGSNDDYKYYYSTLPSNSSLCLSFKNNRLTDCCKQDDMQRIYIHKTSPETGFFHIKDYKKVLCYDMKKNRFKLKKRRKLRVCLRRHQRKREGSRRRRGFEQDCKLSDLDIVKLRRQGCELYESLAFSDTYISFLKNSRYLGLRKGRVQRHKILRDNTVLEPKTNGQKFLAISESSMHKITSHIMCRA